MTDKKRIFVSHSSKDNEMARSIVKALKEHGCDVWYDENDLEFGQFRQNIEVSLSICQVFMVLLSEDACKSRWVQREIDAALGLETAGTDLLIVPVLLSSCTVPPLLAGYKRLDFTSGRDYTAELDHFVRMVNDPQQSMLANDTDTSPASQESDKATTSPQRAVGTLLCTYDIHSSWVVAVAWEPRSNRIASAGGDGLVRVWDADTTQTLLTYREHTWSLERVNIHPTVYAIAWSPDGLRLVSAGDGSKVRVWNASTGQTITVYQGHAGLLPNVFAVAWSPSGRRIASACGTIGIDKTIHVWDATTGKTICKYDAQYGLTPAFSVLAVAWSPDGTRIAFNCGDKTLRIWNATTGRHVSTFKLHSKWVSALAWSSDSRRIALANGDHTAQLWNTVTGEHMLTYHGHTDSLRSIAWSPDETCIATASDDNTVQLWESTTGNHMYTYRGHSNWTTSLAWSPDGTRIASASNDKTVQIWQAR